MLFQTIHFTLFSSLALAAPSIPNDTIFRRTNGSILAIDMIKGIAPNTLTSCVDADYPTECATADHVALAMLNAVAGKDLTAHEIGAITALMAFETADFRYNINHFPSHVPGKGTRNMQSAEFNLEYARSIPDLAGQLAAITTAPTAAGLPGAVLDKVLDLVANDKYTWGSAGWYLKTKCPVPARFSLQTGTQQGFIDYMTCVGVDNPKDPDRMAYWTRAKTTLGI